MKVVQSPSSSGSRHHAEEEDEQNGVPESPSTKRSFFKKNVEDGMDRYVLYISNEIRKYTVMLPLLKTIKHSSALLLSSTCRGVLCLC